MKKQNKPVPVEEEPAEENIRIPVLETPVVKGKKRLHKRDGCLAGNVQTGLHGNEQTSVHGGKESKKPSADVVGSGGGAPAMLPGSPGTSLHGNPQVSLHGNTQVSLHGDAATSLHAIQKGDRITKEDVAQKGVTKRTKDMLNVEDVIGKKAKRGIPNKTVLKKNMIQ